MPDPHAHADSNSNADTYATGNTDTYAHAVGNTDTHATGNPYADADTHAAAVDGQSDWAADFVG
jgi:hypothetical protein